MFIKGKWLALVRDEHWYIMKVARSKNYMKIMRVADIDLSQTKVEDGVSLDPQLTGERVEPEKEKSLVLEESARRLQHWLKKEKMRNKELSITFTCEGVITRIIVLPHLSRKDLNKLLTEQVDQYFSMNIEDYLVDFRILENFIEDGQPRIRVLLAAIPKEQWENFWTICQGAQLRPQVVELAADSIARVYIWSALSSKQGQKYLKRGDLGIKSKQSMLTQLSKVLEDKLPASLQTKLTLPKNRIVQKKPNTQETIEDMVIVSLNKGRTEIVLLENGISFLYSDFKLSRSNTLDPNAEILWENVLVPLFQVLIEFNNFFASRHFGKIIDSFYLTGELADIPGITEMFEDNVGVSAKIGFPKFWRPKFTGQAKNLQANWMKYADLYGLALRED